MISQISQLETKNIELVRKYEESKKNYFKVREEREKLKTEIAKQDPKEEAVTQDITSKYEAIKQKLKQVEDAGKASDKRAVAAETEQTAKTSQLEDLYGQLDSMAEYNANADKQ